MNNFKHDNIHNLRMSISKNCHSDLFFKKTIYARVLSSNKKIDKLSTFIQINTIQRYRLKKQVDKLTDKKEWVRKFNGFYYVKSVRIISIMDLHILYRNMNLFCDNIKDLLNTKL